MSKISSSFEEFGTLWSCSDEMEVRKRVITLVNGVSIREDKGLWVLKKTKVLNDLFLARFYIEEEPIYGSGQVLILLSVD